MNLNLDWRLLAGTTMSKKVKYMKKLKYIAVILALVLSLATNVATLAFSSFALLLSTAFEAITGTSAVVSELKRDGIQKDRRIQDLDGELDTKQKQAAKLSDDLALSNKRANALSDKVTTSEAQRQGLRKELDVKRSEVAGLSDDLAARDRRIAELSKSATNPKVTYRGRQQPLSDAVGDTVERISKRTVVGSSRNVTAVFAESIPMVGAGVAIAVTGYELKDGCDNLKDLRELELSINPSIAYSEDTQVVCGREVPTSEEVWDAVTNSPSAAWDNVKAYLPELGELHLPEISIGDGWERAKEGTSNFWGSTKNSASAAWYVVGDGVGSAWQKMFGD